MTSRPIARVIRTRSAPSCLTSALPGCASDTSGVCFPFCSKAIWKADSFAPGAVMATSTVPVWPTYFVGFAISMAGPARRPA
jgi:hypothetical protein